MKDYKFTTLHQGYEYFDIEVVNDALIFCTKTGDVFQQADKQDTLLFDINVPIRDIYINGNTIYFSADDGVYTITDNKPASLKKLINLPLAVGVISDAQKNLWISTENGLYLYVESLADAIPFIPHVEFNRSALAIYNDHVFVGSIDGLYTIDIYTVMTDFLPPYLNKKQFSFFWWPALILTVLVLLIISGSYFWLKKKRTQVVLSPPSVQAAPVISLKQIESDIRIKNIMSVEALAELYKTNTVQLNRTFKNFDTTPGKFLKKVKLDMAREMMKEELTIQEVVAKTGYSATYIKKNLESNIS